VRVSDTGPHDRWLTAALAEFQALREEIVQRIQLQQVLLGLTITALGALLSVALAGTSSRASLLFATPFVTSALGFAYSDHARRINMLGKYIRDELWRDVRRLTDDGLSSWEEAFFGVISPRTPFQVGLSSAYIVSLFIVSPIAANCYAGVALNWDLASGEWILWAGGLGTTLIYSAYASAVALQYGLKRVSPRALSPPAGGYHT
jgi:hypothetical protein